jgi:tetratricopeptide (TPR) repeat protein
LTARGSEALGSAYWAGGDGASAVSAWESGSGANPQDAALLHQLIAAYRAEAAYPAEERALRQRLALSEDPEAEYLLGILLMTSNPAEARAQLTASAAQEQFKPAASTLLAALSAAAQATDSANGLVIVGRGLGLVQEWRLARQAFEEATRVAPQNALAWAWLGEAKQHLGEGAAADLDHALSLDARNSVVHALRGLYFRRTGDVKRALAECMAAAQLEPENPALQASLAEAQAAGGDLASALANYEAATALAPSDATYWRLLAMFCADNHIQVLEIGLAAAQKAVDLAPQDGQALDALGWSYAQAGYLTKAQQALRQALPSTPEPALVHLHLGQVYLQTGQRPLALDELQSAARLDRDGAAGTAANRLLGQYFPNALAPAPSSP